MDDVGKCFSLCRRLVGAICLGVLGFGWVALGHAAPEYTVIDLGADASVAGITPQGTVFGQYKNLGALLFPSGPVPIGTLPGGDFSSILGRDDVHGTVGTSGTPYLDLYPHAFHRLRGVMRDLGTLDTPKQTSIAIGLNGQRIVGEGDTSGGPLEPIFWMLTGGPPQRLPTLGPGPGFGFTNAISQSGVIIGETTTAAGELHATLWIFGLAYDLTPTGGAYSFAHALNAALTIVGEANNHAWRWTMAHGGEDVGTLPGDDRAQLNAINTAGVAVGSSLGETAPERYVERAIRVGLAGHMVNLNDVVVAPRWVLEEAVGISDRGWIAGNGTWRGLPRSWLLVPLP